MNREIAEKAAQRRKDEMTSSEILLFVKEEVAKYDDGKPSSLVIQAIREACLNLVSSKAAEAPGGQRAEGCSCGSHDLAPLYHHPKCALAPTAPSERADDSVLGLPSLEDWMLAQFPGCDLDKAEISMRLAIKIAKDYAARMSR